MKYKIEDTRMAETVELDIQEFLPSAKGPVIIKIKRLTEKKRAEVQSLIMMGQTINKGGEISIHQTECFLKAREIELIEGIFVDSDFPFERWDTAYIDEIDKRCPEFIEAIHSKIREINRPLAKENDEG
jgi:hypothetical protein